jgi:alpha-L-rhamnosidase
MGLLNPEDWEGVWIGRDDGADGDGKAAAEPQNAPVLRKEFETAGDIRRARVYVSGLGWYQLFLNGRKVGDHVLDPATSDYRKRILYETYDVTSMLTGGTNALGVMLGNGWYCEPGMMRYGGDSPRLLLQLTIEYADGTTKSITSDRS